MTAALRAGVPLVCVPMGRDQADVAVRVVWRGAGLKVRKSADAGTPHLAIQRVFSEPDFRAGARRVAEGMAADPGNRAELEMEAVAARCATMAV